MEIQTNKKFFHKPYKYPEAFFISFILTLIGFLIEFITPGNGVDIPSTPYNVYIFFGVITVIVFIHIFFKERYFIKWLSSVPVAISSIVALSFVVLIMGLTHQEDVADSLLTKMGITHLAKSWVLLVCASYFLLNLGLVIMRRALPLTKKNIGFIFNHFGLWLTVMTAVLGSGDLKRLRMVVFENEGQVWIAEDENKIQYEMPIAIDLKDFVLEEYNPKISLIDNTSGEIINKDGKGLPLIEEGKEYNLLHWTIKIDTLYKFAALLEDKYVEYPSDGACQAVKVTATNQLDNSSISEWLSAGSYIFDYKYIVLDQKYSLVMLQPEPEKYISKVTLYANDKTVIDTVIEVNKPIKINGWKVYQLSYDKTKGRWSEASVFELVRDPWISVVYLGMFFVLAGGLYLFWIGKKYEQVSDNTDKHE